MAGEVATSLKFTSFSKIKIEWWINSILSFMAGMKFLTVNTIDCIPFYLQGQTMIYFQQGLVTKQTQDLWFLM
jgi:hypothetical protein